MRERTSAELLQVGTAAEGAAALADNTADNTQYRLSDSEAHLASWQVLSRGLVGAAGGVVKALPAQLKVCDTHHCTHDCFQSCRS